MRALVDIHVHLYDCFDIPRWIDAAVKNMQDAAQRTGTERDWKGVLCVLSTGNGGFGGLVERVDVSLEGRGYCVEEHREGAARVACPSGFELLLIPGRQIVTYESLEILEVGVESDLPSRHAVDYLLNAIREGGGIPVLPWSPGKWTFRRGRQIRNLIDAYVPGKFILSFSSLLPRSMPLPGLLKLAQRAGYVVAAGSDPLPLPGEEVYVGSPVTLVTAGFDPDRPVTSLRRILLESAEEAGVVGKRPGVATVVLRLFRLARQKRVARLEAKHVTGGLR